MPSFAYLFEQFPRFEQTFVYREAAEMRRQGMEPLLVSIHAPADRAEHAADIGITADVCLDGDAAVKDQAYALADGSRAVKAALRKRPANDAQRLYEAIVLAPVLRARGVRHVHAHFGGMAARTAWWLRELGGFTYSFTGHANDIFCDTQFPVTRAMLVRDAAFIATETDYARGWLEENEPAALGKTFRVFNGIAPDGFEPRERACEPPLILSVGRYVKKKGFDALIDACRILRERRLEFVCEIVGGGELDTSLQARIDAANLGDRVRLAGPRAQAEVRTLLARASVFALACMAEDDGGMDNLPTAIMEAMFAGAPCVSTQLAGVPEMIADGEDGLLVAPHDSAALAGAIENFLRDPVFARSLAARARETAAAKFDIARTTATLKHLLIRHAGVVAPPQARSHDPSLPEPTLRAKLRRWFR